MSLTYDLSGFRVWFDRRIATWAREDAARDRSEKIAALQKLVDDGLASGPCDQSMDEILAEARAQVAATRRV